MIRKNSFRLKGVTIALYFLALGIQSFAWGFYGHRKINRKAVFCLPPQMFSFYKANIDYLEVHAVDPDKRRYAVKGEAPKHYIDLEIYFEKTGCEFSNMLRCLPTTWKQINESALSSEINDMGMVPWTIVGMYYKLQKAFEEIDINAILKLSAEIGHYASDAHVPLHTTENYNGQLTGQKGIHALWESKIPERHGSKYDFLGLEAKYIKNINKSAWKVVKESHSFLEKVLSDENAIRKLYYEDGMYKREVNGQASFKSYTIAYIDAYENLQGQIVESRMRQSVAYVSSLWYTAWINAGQPKLPSIVQEYQFDSKGCDEKDEFHH